MRKKLRFKTKILTDLHLLVEAIVVGAGVGHAVVVSEMITKMSNLREKSECDRTYYMYFYMNIENQ